VLDTRASANTISGKAEFLITRRSVRAPQYVVRRGKMPMLSALIAFWHRGSLIPTAGEDSAS
jgi:hypothetical protein